MVFFLVVLIAFFALLMVFRSFLVGVLWLSSMVFYCFKGFGSASQYVDRDGS